MSYYDLTTDTERAPRRLETKLSDGAQLGPPSTGWTDELLALCGIVPVINTTRPADTATDTTDRSLSRVGDVVTEVWTTRPKTQQEIDAATQTEQDATDLAGWLALKPDYIAFRDSTGSQSNVELTQIARKLCRGMLRLMRSYEQGAP